MRKYVSHVPVILGVSMKLQSRRHARLVKDGERERDKERDREKKRERGGRSENDSLLLKLLTSFDFSHKPYNSTADL